MVEPARTPLEELTGPLDDLLESIARHDPPALSLSRLASCLEQELAPAWCVVGMTGEDRPRLFHSPRLPAEVVDELRAHDGGRLFCGPHGALQVMDRRALPADDALGVLMDDAGMATVWLLAVGEPVSGRSLGGIVLLRASALPPTVAELVVLRRYQNLTAILIGRLHRDRQLQHDARHDKLTGLPNRAAVVARVATALSRRGDDKLAVLCVGLKRFSAVNESIGRHAGDQLLQLMAERLRHVVRPTDLVGRLDGASFVIVCEGLHSPLAAERLGERVVVAIGEPAEVDGLAVVVSASVGIAFGVDAPGVAADAIATAEELLQQAATAARQPSRSGGSVEVYRADLRARTAEQLALETSLRTALERDELVVRYQPQVGSADRQVVGVEALLRWQLDGRSVGPDAFIPIAERTGLIGPIGRWVLDQATTDLAAWDAEADLPRLGVTVNLSAHQLADVDLETSVKEVLAASQVDPSRVCLEITETALVQDPDGAARVLDRLKALGLGVAIDDFGTGYASLEYLRRFPMADMLKIDRTFVDGVAQPGTNDAAIVAAAVGLGRSLGMVTVAEGVETEAQAAVLRELGCDRLQGNLFGIAVPASEIPLLVRGAAPDGGA